MKNINSLAFDGGGMYGLSYLGAVPEIAKRIDLRNIKVLAGTSVGSIVSFALAIGVNLAQLDELVNKVRILALKKIPSIAINLPFNVLFNYGLIDNSLVRDVAILILRSVYPNRDDILFKDIPVDLIIPATNLNDSFFVCSKYSTPYMSVIDAVVYSCTGNVVLTPCSLKLRKQNRDILVADGGVSILNYPVSLFSTSHKPSYVTNMLDNENSEELYAQYGGSFTDLCNVIQSYDSDTMIGLRFDDENRYTNIRINNVLKYVWQVLNISYFSLFATAGQDTKYTITINLGCILPVDIRYLIFPWKTREIIELGRKAVANSRIFD